MLNQSVTGQCDARNAILDFLDSYDASRGTRNMRDERIDAIREDSARLVLQIKDAKRLSHYLAHWSRSGRP